VLQGLVEDGYRVLDAEGVKDEESQQVFEEVKAASQELYGRSVKRSQIPQPFPILSLRNFKIKKPKSKPSGIRNEKHC
jgi:hypothetical protein